MAAWVLSINQGRYPGSGTEEICYSGFHGGERTRIATRILNVIRDGETLRKPGKITENGNYGIYYTRLYEALRNNVPLPVTAEEGRNVTTSSKRPIKAFTKNESSHAEEPGEDSIVVASCLRRSFTSA